MASIGEIGSTTVLTRVCEHEGYFDNDGTPLAPTTIDLGIHKTCAYYLGHVCTECGAPLSRMSGYYGDYADAEQALAVTLAGSHDEFRNTTYRPGLLTVEDFV